MNIDGEISQPKKPRNEISPSQISEIKVEEVWLDNENTDDINFENFGFDDDEDSFSDDDEGSQLLSLQPSICFDSTVDVPIHYDNQSTSAHHDLVSDQPSTSDSTPTWTSTGEMEDLKFIGENVFHGPQGGEAVDYFNYLFDYSFLQYICNQTNEQAVQLLFSEKTTQDSRITRWKALTVEELKVFLGLLFHMGTIQLNRIQDYWKTDRLFAIPIFTKQMSRNRFLIIMRCLYFTSETSKEDPLYKVRPVIDYFNEKMADCYYPGRQLSMDESMILWRGRLVKLYLLTEPDGLILKFIAHSGNKGGAVGKDYSEKIVFQLLEDYLGKGHEVYMDNYYNSVNLARNLLSNKTYCTGPLRSDIKSNPKEVMRKKLKRGENISRFCDGIHVGKWQDKHDVTYITTQYTDRFVPVSNKGGLVNKPECIARYNDFMSHIDRQDQLLSFYPCESKTVGWHLKIAVHIFQLLFMNSFKMYNKYSETKMRLYEFRLSVVDKLLPEKSEVPDIPPRVTSTHTITRILERAPNNRIKRKPCRQCHKRRKRTDSTWHCLGCYDKPGLCVECFDAYHAEL